RCSGLGTVFVKAGAPVVVRAVDHGRASPNKLTLTPIFGSRRDGHHKKTLRDRVALLTVGRQVDPLAPQCLGGVPWRKTQASVCRRALPASLPLRRGSCGQGQRVD